ncbi:hypothetical protein [Streptomyces sp. NPDC088762]|uniref:hypothetical protein n=1 Tax=Streptomyces sp. NPDC088762 TaxID=3365891 RepID=UPI0037F60F40
MSTARWLRISLQRYVLTALIGWAVAAAVPHGMGDQPLSETFAVGMGVGLIGVPLLTFATLFVITLRLGRQPESVTGDPQRLQGAWMIVLPLAPLLPVGLLVPLQYLIIVSTQFVYAGLVLPPLSPTTQQTPSAPSAT